MTQQENARAVPAQGKRIKPWYVQLWFHVLVAMVVGIALGHLYPDLGAKMQPLGDGFIKAIHVLIAPIIFCTVVHYFSRSIDASSAGHRRAISSISIFAPGDARLSVRRVIPMTRRVSWTGTGIRVTNLART